jgi:chromosome segregation protein
VHFTRLRLSGFKSFVDTSDFQIEPGLTGIVGPNGCGKSNLLEAMRWVMGANSAKAMRGEAMEDVIFSGSAARPSRNHAEVVLTIDNSDGAAPAAFSGEAVLEVTRRIDRGEGSSYRINAREARARDVQLLFADASTGANSPALVRQGQISELIAAKPQNRRRILEEAAGISGLHGRRHEAELRVRAAEVNMGRLDDLIAELGAGLARLRREARAAERYKALSARIRVLRGRLLHARWRDARTALEQATAQSLGAARAAEEAVRAAAAASTRALGAAEAIAPLRDQETAASAVLHRMALEKDRLDRALEAAAAESARLAADLVRIQADCEREDQIVGDAAGAGARLAEDIAAVEAEIANAPERLPRLAAAHQTAEAARVAAEGEVEALASALAAAEADRRGAEMRQAEALSRRERAHRALEETRRERQGMGPVVDPARAAAAEALAGAEARLALARAALEAAETERADAQGAESAARRAARSAEDALAQASVEARALAQLNAPAKGAAFPPILDSISAAAGLEAALAAALGEDLSGALDSRAQAHWAGREAPPPVWPEGVEPLAGHVTAPAALAARLAWIGVVDRAEGPRLQSEMPPGARLVSREGDFWRWDGFSVSAQAPRPAQVRLEQRARQRAADAQVASLAPQAEAARRAHDQAVARVKAAEAAVQTARAAPRGAETDLARARERLDILDRERTRREMRVQALDEALTRLAQEAAETDAALEASRIDLASLAADVGAQTSLAAARAKAAEARESAAAARAALDAERRECDTRARRLAVLKGEGAAWADRARTAHKRRLALEAAKAATLANLDTARDAPRLVEMERQTLLEALAVAERRRDKAADSLAAAEAVRVQADGDARSAEARAAEAREVRASLAARQEAARTRLDDAAQAILDATGLEPAALAATLADEPQEAGDAAEAETRLAGLERERDAMGPVNLRAEEDGAELAQRLETLAAERDDLAGALSRLRQAIAELNAEGRERLTAAFEVIDGHFRDLFRALFQGGEAELRLVESEDPLEAGLEILACPPGKRMAVMSLMSGGEQALTAVALIFAVFLANPAPICVLDEVDAPLDDANVERFCNLLTEMRGRASTRFIVITHNPLTMSRMDRLYGVTMRERGVSQLVSVDLRQAEALVAQ